MAKKKQIKSKEASKIGEFSGDRYALAMQHFRDRLIVEEFLLDNKGPADDSDPLEEVNER